MRGIAVTPVVSGPRARHRTTVRRWSTVDPRFPPSHLTRFFSRDHWRHSNYLFAPPRNIICHPHTLRCCRAADKESPCSRSHHSRCGAWLMSHRLTRKSYPEFRPPRRPRTCFKQVNSARESEPYARCQHHSPPSTLP